MSYSYDVPKSIDKNEFLDIVSAGVIALVCDAIVRSAHFIHDYDWLLQQYILLLKHPNIEVRGVTVTCIGHLARLCENADKAQLLEILDPLLSDDELSGRVEDAIDDVRTFL